MLFPGVLADGSLIATAASIRTSLGLGTGDSPTFAGVTAPLTGTVNGVTLTTGGSATQYLNGQGNYVSISGGVTSLNALTGDLSIAVGTSGTDFSVSPSGSTVTLNLPNASATARGVVSTGTQTFAGAKTVRGLFKVVDSSTPAFVLTNDDTSGTTTRYGYMGAGHFTLSEEPVATVISFNSSTENNISIGGGSSSMNAATSVTIYTAANTTTTTGTARVVVSTDGNIGFGQSTFGTSAAKVVAHSNGTAPGSSPADCYQLYSADQAAGNACPHIRTENGAIIKLYQQAANADTSGATLGALETEVNELKQLLRNNGLLAA